MSGLAILCSGQGFQNADMFALTAEAPEAAPVFEAATKLLNGQDPRELAKAGDGLYENKTGQILCCAAALAAWAVLSPFVPRPRVVAGYSVGELAAWGVTDMFGLTDILELAAERAAVMDAFTKEPSGLAAIRGLHRKQLEPLCALHGAYIAIVNTEDQMVVGGTCPAVLAVVAAAQAAGATRTTALRVSVASHTPLLSEAAEQFSRSLKRRTLTGAVPSDMRLLSSIDGSAVLEADAGLAKLAEQMQRTVEWQACMESCASAAVTKALELGPGSALARMASSALPHASILSVAEFRTLKGLIQWVNTPAP